MKKYYKLLYYQKKLVCFWGILVTGIFFIYILLTSIFLYLDKKNEDVYWTKYLNENPSLNLKQKMESTNATDILTGVYIENINEINIKESNYVITFEVWFKWKGDKSLNMLDNYDIYNGHIASQKVLENYSYKGVNYQSARVTATVAKVFWTTRFPLGSYQLRFYLKPKQSISNIVLKADDNSFINKNINVSGFTVRRFATNIFVKEYENNKSKPETLQNFTGTSTEFMTAIEFNRENFGLYIKCFIALIGTLIWVLIVLYICTYHNVNPLSMIPSALFGAVSNILVGANLVPDALHTGLLEFVNIGGILTIILVSFAIITINRQRVYYKDDKFALFLGRRIFWSITIFTISGNIILPLSAYLF